MFDIYGLVEVESCENLTFYFVSIDLNDSCIKLSDRTNGKKPLNISIPLSDIENFHTKTIYDTDQISFTYQDNHYKFVEYGNQTISIFGKILEERLTVLTH
ncbi:MAG: hypothetical protein RR554_01940 [Vagococcus sp.]|uniref:hypothetical protein n=1 Tax=Vagococcus sp. TaxID=1933889 RepID=UPI002FC6468A